MSTLGLNAAALFVNNIDFSIPVFMRLVVHTIDLAVVSYAGAHIDPFDEDYFGERAL